MQGLYEGDNMGESGWGLKVCCSVLDELYELEADFCDAQTGDD